MQLMDAMTTYSYGSLISNIYIKVPEGLTILNPKTNRNMFLCKTSKSLYDLEQLNHMVPPTKRVPSSKGLLE